MFSEITNKGEFNQEMYEFVFRFYIGRYYLKNVFKKRAFHQLKCFCRSTRYSFL